MKRTKADILAAHANAIAESIAARADEPVAAVIAEELEQILFPVTIEDQDHAVCLASDEVWLEGGACS